MNRYIPIIKHELQSIKAVFIVMCLSFYFSGVLKYKSEFSELFLTWSEGNLYSLYLDMVSIPIISLFNYIFVLVLIIAQYRDMEDKFVYSLPYKKSEFFIVKSICGVSCITLVFIIYALFILQIHSDYKFIISDVFSVFNVLEPVQHYFTGTYVIYNIAFIWLSYIALYIFLLFFKAIVKNQVFAAVFGTIALFFPSFFCYTMEKVIYLFTGLRFRAPYILNPQNLIYWTASQSVDVGNVSSSYMERYISVSCIDNMNIVSIGLCIFIIVFFLLAYVLFKKDEQADSMSGIRFSWARYAFVFFATLCSLLLTAYCVIAVFESRIVVLILMIAGTAVGFIVSNKFVELTCLHKKRRAVNEK